MQIYKNCLALLALFIFLAPAAARADDAPPPLPKIVTSHVSAPLQLVGAGTYRKFGFRVYNATLWCKDKNWRANKPYALQLQYTRGLSKDTLVDTVMDDIREQNVADDATLTHWHDVLNAELPAVEDGDVLIGLSQPGKKSQLFYNGKQIASIDDAALSKAFFNIWLGPGADTDLHNELLGKEDQ